MAAIILIATASLVTVSSVPDKGPP
jgi:hypothetical protein